MQPRTAELQLAPRPEGPDPVSADHSARPKGTLSASLPARPDRLARRRVPSVRLRVPDLTVPRYVGAVTIAGLAAFSLPPTWSVEVERWLPAFVALTALSFGLEFVTVSLPYQGVLSVATISHVATILLVPPPFAAISVTIAILAEQLIHRKSLVKLAFNGSSYVLTASLASLVVGLIGNPWTAAETGGHLLVVVMFVASALTYYALNDVLTAGIIALVSERSVLYVLRANGRNTFTAEAGAATIGALFAVIWMTEPIWTLLLAVPASVTTRALRYIRRLESETRSAVRTLAGTIDDRDASTFHHSERVAEYALLLARELDVPEETVELIEQAAAVHDLGKIGIPDRVLLKEGPLTHAEQTTMWLHTEIGAKILSSFEQFRPGADIVLHHHENYDGSGYPRGLAGEAIPLGARVVAVADAFDAMTSNRPYRRALSHEEAVRRLRAGAGRQWDPVIVGVFLKLVSEGRFIPAGDHEPLHIPSAPDADPDRAEASRVADPREPAA